MIIFACLLALFGASMSQEIEDSSFQNNLEYIKKKFGNVKSDEILKILNDHMASINENEDEAAVDRAETMNEETNMNIPEEGISNEFPEHIGEETKHKASFEPIPGAKVSDNVERFNPEKEIYSLIDPCSETQKDGRITVRPEPMSRICKSDKNKKGRSCPPFEPVPYPGSCGFEARLYAKSTWVATNGTFENGSFRRLYKYIAGGNEDKKKIEMTSPVCNYYIMKDRKTVYAQFMAFFMDHDDLPQPIDDSIKIVNKESVKLFVRAFGGRFPSEDTYRREFENLGAALVKAGVKNVNWLNPIVLEYNAPWALMKRHEVAFPSL